MGLIVSSDCMKAYMGSQVVEPFEGLELRFVVPFYVLNPACILLVADSQVPAILKQFCEWETR